MIIILGGSGYVGNVFARKLQEAGKPYRVFTRKDFDFLNEQRLREEIERYSPEFVINAAGFVGKPNVDACEEQRLECIEGNVELPYVVASVCDELGVPWGHVSSGCIFSGRREDGLGFIETDVPNFSFRKGDCSFYSGCKALGEESLGYRSVSYGDEERWECNKIETGYIWRLRIPFNAELSSRNYLYKLVAYDKLLEVENSFACLEDYVDACLMCWEKRVPFGIYNVTNPGAMRTSRIVSMMIREGRWRESRGMLNPFREKYSFFKDVNEFMERAAKTPRSSCVLDSSKLKREGIVMRSLEDAVQDSLQNWGAEMGAEFRVAV